MTHTLAAWLAVAIVALGAWTVILQQDNTALRARIQALGATCE